MWSFFFYYSDFLWLVSAAHPDRRWKSAAKWQKAVCAPVPKAERRYLEKSLLLYIYKYIFIYVGKKLYILEILVLLNWMTSATVQ